MTGSAKRKGDAAEREAASLLRHLTGFPVRRKLGAGRQDDEGDLDGLPETVLQVASYGNVADAIRLKVPACVAQQRRAGARFGAVMLRRRGGDFVIVMTPDQYAALVLEAIGSRS